MTLSDIRGNDAVVTALRQMLGTGRIPHAIMFSENDGGGAMPLVLAFLSELYPNSAGKVAKLIHPDVHFIFPVTAGSKVSDKPSSEAYLKWWRELVTANPWFYESELYSALGIEGKAVRIAVGEAEYILDKLSLTGVEGGYRTVFIYLPEKMNREAASRLLKIVEEPPQDTLFLLITHAPEKVLQTISSRCLMIRVMPPSAAESASLHPESSDAEGLRDLFADIIGAIIRRNLSEALEAADAVAALPSREVQKAFCIKAGEGLRNIFLLQQGREDIASFSPEEGEFLRGAASSLKKNFPRLALSRLDKAMAMLEANVSQKILFTDLVCKWYVNI